MDSDKLQEVIASHGKWIKAEGGERADLRGADLRDARLNWCKGNMQEIKSAQIAFFEIVWTYDMVFIGCKSKTLEEWKEWEPTEEYAETWEENKQFIFDMIERYPAKETKGGL